MKTISPALGIIFLALWIPGCYSTLSVDKTNLRDFRDQTIFVKTKEGLEYKFFHWEVLDNGNIEGTGFDSFNRKFEGVIPAEKIADISVYGEAVNVLEGVEAQAEVLIPQYAKREEAGKIINTTVQVRISEPTTVIVGLPYMKYSFSGSSAASLGNFWIGFRHRFSNFLIEEELTLPTMSKRSFGGLGVFIDYDRLEHYFPGLTALSLHASFITDEWSGFVLQIRGGTCGSHRGKFWGGDGDIYLDLGGSVSYHWESFQAGLQANLRNRTTTNAPISSSNIAISALYEFSFGSLRVSVQANDGNQWNSRAIGSLNKRYRYVIPPGDPGNPLWSHRSSPVSIILGVGATVAF